MLFICCPLCFSREGVVRHRAYKHACGVYERGRERERDRERENERAALADLRFVRVVLSCALRDTEATRWAIVKKVGTFDLTDVFFYLFFLLGHEDIGGLYEMISLMTPARSGPCKSLFLHFVFFPVAISRDTNAYMEKCHKHEGVIAFCL